MPCLWRSSALLRGATLGSHFPFYSPSTDSWGLVFLGPRLWQLWIFFLLILLHPTRGGDPGVTFLRILSLLLHFFTVTRQDIVGSHSPSHSGSIPSMPRLVQSCPIHARSNPSSTEAAKYGLPGRLAKGVVTCTIDGISNVVGRANAPYHL